MAAIRERVMRASQGEWISPVDRADLQSNAKADLAWLLEQNDAMREVLVKVQKDVRDIPRINYGKWIVAADVDAALAALGSARP